MGGVWAGITHQEPPLSQSSRGVCSCPSRRRCHLGTAGGRGEEGSAGCEEPPPPLWTSRETSTGAGRGGEKRGEAQTEKAAKGQSHRHGDSERSTERERDRQTETWRQRRAKSERRTEIQREETGTTQQRHEDPERDTEPWAARSPSRVILTRIPPASSAWVVG